MPAVQRERDLTRKSIEKSRLVGPSLLTSACFPPFCSSSFQDPSGKARPLNKVRNQPASSKTKAEAPPSLFYSRRRCSQEHQGTAGLWGPAQPLAMAAAAIESLDLHEAIKAGQGELATALLLGGAPLDTQDEHLRTPLHAAAEKEIAGMVQLLLQKGAPADKPDGDGCTPLHLAAQAGRAGSVRALLAAGANPTRLNRGDWSPLEAAAQEGHGDVLRVMGEFGADVNFLDGSGWAVLHWANGQTVVDALVEAGANIEVRNQARLTPLAHATKACNLETVRALVSHGAEVNTRDEHGDTPLHFAAQWAGRESASELVDFLLRSGADETAVNKNGERPTDVVGQLEFRLYADLERARNLLAAAPVDRAWRRRGLLPLCRARHSAGQLLITGGLNTQGDIEDVLEPGSVGSAGGGAAERRACGEWGRAAAWVVGLGLGKEGIFRAIAGYL